MDKKFYTWNWVGGGYNQAYATSEAEALLYAKNCWAGGVVDMSTLKVLNKEEEKEYWKNFPIFD